MFVHLDFSTTSPCGSLCWGPELNPAWTGQNVDDITEKPTVCHTLGQMAGQFKVSNSADVHVFRVPGETGDTWRAKTFLLWGGNGCGAVLDENHQWHSGVSCSCKTTLHIWKCLYVYIKANGGNNTTLTFCSTAQWSVAILQCWPLRHFSGHGVSTTSTQHFLRTLWGSIITLKGVWELFIQWLVPAIKFDWLTYIPALMFIPLASGPLHSPSKKVGYSGAGWGGMDGVGRYSENAELQYVFTPNITRENRSQTLWPSRRNSAQRPHVGVHWSAEVGWRCWEKVNLSLLCLFQVCCARLPGNSTGMHSESEGRWQSSAYLSFV